MILILWIYAAPNEYGEWWIEWIHASNWCEEKRTHGPHIPHINYRLSIDNAVDVCCQIMEFSSISFDILHSLERLRCMDDRKWNVDRFQLVVFNFNHRPTHIPTCSTVVPHLLFNLTTISWPRNASASRKSIIYLFESILSASFDVEVKLTKKWPTNEDVDNNNDDCKVLTANWSSFRIESVIGIIG